jgi:zinc/manganese transport system substrate-binding protein
MAMGPAKRTVTLGAMIAILLVACGASPAQEDDAMTIVATTSVLGDIVSAVAGDQAEVEVLIPLGVDAHDFSPSSRQAALIAGADLVVSIGLGLEEGIEDVLTAASGGGVEVLEVAPDVDPIPLQGAPGQDDPHFWMDPLRAGEAARVIARALQQRAPGDWEARAAVYAAEMDTTDATVRSTLAAVPAVDRDMVTNHASFGYFADRYDFEIVAVVIPGGSTLLQPSSARLAGVIEAMQEAGTSVIFAGTTEPAAVAEAITADLGGEAGVVALHTESLGEPGSEAGTLSGMLITNAERIAEALA